MVPALLNHARSDADPQVRQLAAVVLKRRVLAHWSKLPRDHQEQVKNILLDAIVKEPLGVVRRSVADVVSKVAKATVPMGQWNQLPEFLAQCTQSPEEAHRDVAFVLFASLTETIISVMTQHFATLGGLFRAGLGDASLSVRLAALRAVLALICNMSGEPGEIKIAQELVPHVISTARNAIAAGEETNAGLAYEVLDELIESQPKALAGHIPDVVGFCVEVASAPGLESVTRRRALDVIAFLARYKPKALLRAKLVAPLLRVLCPLCGEPRRNSSRARTTPAKRPRKRCTSRPSPRSSWTFSPSKCPRNTSSRRCYPSRRPQSRTPTEEKTRGGGVPRHRRRGMRRGSVQGGARRDSSGGTRASRSLAGRSRRRRVHPRAIRRIFELPRRVRPRTPSRSPNSSPRCRPKPIERYRNG